MAMHSGLENSMDCTAHGVTKSRARLSLYRHTYIYPFLYKFFFRLCCCRISSRVACGFVVGPVQAQLIQMCPTLSDTKDCSLLGSSVHGILQARILERLDMSLLAYLPNPGIQPKSPSLQGDSLTTEPSRKPKYMYM